jgi:hypothetical protein
MDLNEYTLEMLVREKLTEARLLTARRALIERARPPRPSLRARLGAGLIALGVRLATGAAARVTPGVSRG